MHTHTSDHTTEQQLEADASPVGTMLIRRGLVAAAMAVIAVMATYLLSLGLGVELLVAGPDGSAMGVTSGNIFGMTILGASLGFAIAYAFGRWAPRPRQTFVVTSLVGLAAYAVVPFAAAESVSTALWLNAFHLAVAVPVILVLARGIADRRA